ncbi:MAG: FAD-dependent oxidoreductase [Armatimonadota bacterium]
MRAIIAVIMILIPAITTSKGVTATEKPVYSAGDGGVEAIAVSTNAIDIYLPIEHGTVTILRDGLPLKNVTTGDRKYRDQGLNAGTTYTYTVAGLSESPITVSEQTFPMFQPSAVYQVVIVGATAAGTAAAVSAARLGADVALVEETNRAGGMAANGLSSTDIRDISKSNGFFEEFRSRVASYYGSGNGLRYEPRIANAVMKSMIYGEKHITFFRRTRATGIIRQGPRTAGVQVTNLDTGEVGELYGQIVIDATVEADVADAAGVRFRIPREARSKKEPHAGYIYYDDTTGEILPGSTGEADERIQSYAYLITVKDYGEGADKSIPEPPDYNPEDYRYSPPWKESWAFTSGRLPNGKFEINQHPWGTDLSEINYDYLYASSERRAEIDLLYRWRALGYLYYLQNELGMKSLGLADDEYPDNGNFPPTLYVREARRMIGLDSMDESDVTFARERSFADSIAIGDYPMDSHAAENLTDPNARHKGEGEFWLANYTPWYRVPIGIIIPEDTPGLLVLTAVSATHVTYGTLRMEPVRMSLGQAAGTCAALALRYSTYPDRMPAAIIQDRLLTQKAYITWYEDVDKNTRHFRAIQFLGVRGFFPEESFRPEDNLTQEEAAWLMDRLVKVETSGPTANSETAPPQGGNPITRTEFAQLLVDAKRQVDASWVIAPLGVSHYADLQAGSPVSALAETLYNHRIDTRGWAGPPSEAATGLFFSPDAPITRADAAQAIWLAHRPVAMEYRERF